MSDNNEFTPPTKESQIQAAKSDMANILSSLNQAMGSQQPTTKQVITESTNQTHVVHNQSNASNQLVLGGVSIFQHSNDEIYTMVESYIMQNGMDEYICSVMSQAFSLDHVLAERKVSQKNFQYYKSIGETELMEGERSRYNRLNKRAKVLTETIAKLGKEL